MIRHVVMFRWKDVVDDAHVEATAAALRRLQSVIPQVVDYHCGPDVGAVPGNFDFAVAAAFAGIDDYITYRDHPEHRAVVQSMIGPFVAERCAVQFAD